MPDLGRVIPPRWGPALEQVERAVAVVGGEAELLRGYGDKRIPHLFGKHGTIRYGTTAQQAVAGGGHRSENKKQEHRRGATKKKTERPTKDEGIYATK